MALNKGFALHTITNKELVPDTTDPVGFAIQMPEIVEIAGALTEDIPTINEYTWLCIQASPNKLGDGDVSSNLRFKGDNQKNNEGCEKWVDILGRIKEGIYCTSLPREQRLRMYIMNDDGTIDVFNKEKDELPEEKRILKEFLENFGMDQEKVKVMKGASEHSATYLADMLSFIMVMESFHNKYSFTSTCAFPEIVKAGDERLKPVDKGDGKIWEPVEGNDYLYFTPCDDGKGVRFMTYSGDPNNLYVKLQDLLSLEENEAKADIRKMFTFCKAYNRWSDVWINDIDDALAIYMILNAYSHTELKDYEADIKRQIEEITSTFFQ